MVKSVYTSHSISLTYSATFLHLSFAQPSLNLRSHSCLLLLAEGLVKRLMVNDKLPITIILLPLRSKKRYGYEKTSLLTRCLCPYL